MYFLSTKAKKVYTEVDYKDDVYLVFGPESRGIPEDYILENFIPDTNNYFQQIIFLFHQFKY